MPLRSCLLPGQVLPMLAYAVPRPFDSPLHLFEPKWDGYRCLVFLEGGETRLQSRNLRDITADFPSLRALHRRVLARRAVLDGEITAWEGGRPSFSALQARSGRVVFVAFDCLEVEGRPLLDRPLEERRTTLERIVITPGTSAGSGDTGPGDAWGAGAGAGDAWRAGAGAGDTAAGDAENAGAAGAGELILSPVVAERGCSLFRRARDLGLEGVVGKERGSPYLPGQRSRYWLKVKVRRTADCVIVGYRLAPGGGLGSLVLALPGQRGWQVVGKVGTGWDGATAARLLSLLRLLAPGPAPSRLPPEFRKGVSWVEPRVVCSVAYLEVTREGMLRHTSFQGLRPDLEPAAAGRERLLTEEPPGPRGTGDGRRPVTEGE